MVNINSQLEIACDNSLLLGNNHPIVLPENLGNGYFSFNSPCDGLRIALCDAVFFKNLETHETAEDGFYVMSFCLADSLGWENIDIDNNRTSYINKGEYCILKNEYYNTLNYYEKDKRYLGLGISFEPKRFSYAVETIIENKLSASIDKGVGASLKFGMSHEVEGILFDILHCSYTGSLKNIYLEGKLLELISTVINELVKNMANNDFIDISQTEKEALNNIRKIISRNYAEPLTIKELSRIGYLSESRLKSGFKKMFGVSPYQYVLGCRMEKARELLEEAYCRVNEAASFVGYTNMSHFSEAFKKKFGYSPSEYKALCKKRNDFLMMIKYNR